MFNAPLLKHLAAHVHAPRIHVHAGLAHAWGIVEGER
jgi:hypothetical protein